MGDDPIDLVGLGFGAMDVAASTPLASEDGVGEADLWRFGALVSTPAGECVC